MLNTPFFQKDQTIESMVSLIAISNGQSENKILIENLFGNKYIDIHSAFIKNLEDFYQKLDHSDFESKDYFFKKHHQLALTLPFMSKEEREILIHKHLSQKYGGQYIDFVHIKKTLFRNKNWYCRDCIRKEIDEYGYAYAHRLHQVKGIQICSVHHKILGYADDSNSNITPGIVLNKEVRLEKPYLKTVNYFQKIEQLNLCYWIKAFYCEEIKVFRHLDYIILKLLGNLEKQITKNSIDSLTSLLRDTYSEKFLSGLGLSLCEKSTKDWPAQYLYGVACNTHPLANILLLNAIFRSVNSYKEFIQSTNIKNIPKSKQDRTIRPMSSYSISSAAIDAYRSGASLEELERNYKIKPKAFYCLIRYSPVLKKAHSERVNKNRDATKIKHTRNFLKLVKTNPKNRTAIAREDWACYKWIYINNRSLIEKHFPLKKKVL